VRRTFKILALVIGLTAATVLGILGFAIWVFIPILPAGIIWTIAVLSIRRKQSVHEAKPAKPAEDIILPKAA
jgi:hypothetical protein